MKSQISLAKRVSIGALVFGSITGAVVASVVCWIKCQIIGNQIGSTFASKLIPDNPAVTLLTTHDSQFGYMLAFPAETLAVLSVALSVLVPIGSLLGAGLWGLYSSTAKFQKGASNFNILIAFPTLVIVCAVLVWQCFPNTSTAFIPSRWAQNIQERQAMFEDLTAHQELKGKRRKAIEDLLGQPDATSILRTKSPNTVAYHCGLNRLLVISYDPKDESMVRYDLVPFDVPQVFVETAMPIAYDYQGHPLSWQTESFTLAANLANIDVGGKRIQSPENIREETKAVLAKQIDGNGCLRVSATETPISDWTATRLDDAKIFICGCSEYDSEACQKGTWIFDSAKGSMAQGPAMSERRANPMLKRLHDGRVLIAGGLGFQGRRLASCEIYDPQSNTSSKAGCLLVPRTESGIAQLSNGDILIVGGTTNEGLRDAGGELTSTAELMSLKDGKFEHRFAGSLPIGRSDPIVVPTDQNRALVVGGWWVTGVMEDSAYYRGANLYIGNKE